MWFTRSHGAQQQNDQQRQHHQNVAPHEQFTVQRLQDLYATLHKHQDLSSGNMATQSGQAVLIETIRAIAEVIVYGDQHTEQLFDYFCEKNMLPLFLGLLDQPNCSTTLKVQIIQSVSILVQNIRSEISLYYTLSNNHVNRLISHKFDFTNEEILGHYISFLKTLSLRLNKNTIQFFFNDRLHTFPLFEEATKFFDHPEGMVRTAVRTITLNVFRVDDPIMLRFLLEGPAVHYIEKVVRYIHQRCRRLHLLLVRAGLPEPDKRLPLKLEVALTEQQDHMLYLEDILSLNIDGMEDTVVNAAMAYLFLPLLMASLLPATFPFSELDDMDDADFKQAGLSKQDVNLGQGATGGSGSLLALFLLAHALFVFSNPKMVTRITEAMFIPAPLLLQDDDHEHEDEKSSRNERPKSDDDIDHDQGPNEEDEANLSDETDGAGSILGSSNPVTRSAGPQQNVADPCAGSSSTASASGPRSQDQGNPVGLALLRFLEHDNERHCLAAASILYALIHNPNLDPTVFAETGLAPQPDAPFPRPLVRTLLQVLVKDPPVSTLCQRVVAKLAIDLLYESKLDHARDLDFLNRAYMASLVRFRAQLQSFETHEAARFIGLFEREWNSLCQGPLKVESLMTRPETLLPSHPSMPLDARQPFSGLEVTQAAIRSFMILRLLWVTLHNKPNSLLALVGSSGTSTKEDAPIDLSKCDYIKASILNPKGALAALQPAFLVLAGGALVLAQPEKALEHHVAKGIVRTVAPLQHVRFAMAADDPLLMYLAVRSPTNQPIGWAHRQLAPLRAAHSPASAAVAAPLQQQSGHPASKSDQVSQEKDHQLAQAAELFPWVDETETGASNPAQAPNMFGAPKQSTGSTWFLALRFSDHATAFWAQEQLERATQVTIAAKIKRMHRLIAVDGSVSSGDGVSDASRTSSPNPSPSPSPSPSANVSTSSS
ncbi:Protein CLEC16A-like [Hondaea fermentalgiana]|uniref:Protein CLEC16A-like n=1 Tax=Hondaea fermentalgiana TaxID=2315210 RepID=A0A2R5GU26_9STRA|nr:Protein CLEC16A-like [Hondaea fermentalgiana]|eukprot:GBG33258.1 Protein CLEC16A-like [Hondaea fermentalgiana]